SNSYFIFTRKERNGTIFLLLIILLLISVPVIYPFLIKEKIIKPADINKELAELQIRSKDTNRYSRNDDEDHYKNFRQPYTEKKYSSILTVKGVVFYFDPNTLPPDGWKKLGIRDKTIQTIQNFISKGGKFREPEDLKKIWGLHEDQIQRLLPYVKIKETAVDLSEDNKPVFQSNKYERKNPQPIDINLADTIQFKGLPGIGDKLSKRIVTFREKLGGFYSIDQVAETFGLPDSVFQKIKPYLQYKTEELKLININTATIDELKMHPYIRYGLGNAIIQYRNQHGNFSNITELRRIMLINDDFYSRISKYLTVK
ncbi:MAG: helix-hairpin-helix domain-containing protein, partial [Ferruginibacter sp.]